MILPGCEDDETIEGFLRSYTWVDFRQGRSNPLDQLCRGIGIVETPPKPIVAVVPTSNSDERSQLIVYCQNAGLLVPRAGIYPADPRLALELFTADIGECDLVVHLDEKDARYFQRQD